MNFGGSLCVHENQVGWLDAETKSFGKWLFISEGHCGNKRILRVMQYYLQCKLW